MELGGSTDCGIWVNFNFAHKNHEIVLETLGGGSYAIKYGNFERDK